MKKSILLFLFAGLLTACTGNDDTVANRLNGSWTLTNYLGDTTAGTPVLDEGDIQWSINGEEITVTNNVYGQFPETLPSGVYDVVVNEAEHSIVIEDGDNYLHFTYTLTNGELLLTQVNNGADGAVMVFN
jgi:hypothetical protein